MAKRNQTNDPVYTIFDTIFKSIWWLISLPFKDRRKSSALDQAKVEFQSHWLKIDTLMQQQQFRDAVMSSDILLDKALQAHGVNGMNLGERLKNATSKMSKETLDAAWSAHKVRNRLAHELHYQLSEAEAKQAVSDFRKVLRELGLL